MLHVLPAVARPAGHDHGAGAGPIVVCGATGDPATPLDSTRRWPPRSRTAASSIVADQHTCYGVTACADDIINDYLVNLDVPPAETQCARTTVDTTVGTVVDTGGDTA